MQITEQHHNAANEIIELIADLIGKNRVIHPGTSITSCARLSGSFLFRSFEFSLDNIKPGNIVLSEQANEKGPILVNLVEWILGNLNITIDKEEFEKNTKAESNLDFLESLNLLQNEALKVMQKYNLDFEQMAYACALSTAFIIKECQQELNAVSGFHTAIYSFIEGSKTCPPEFSNQNTKRKSIFSFWK